MIQKIQVTPNQWSEIQIPSGNFSLVNQSQEVCYCSDVADPLDLSLESLVFTNLKLSFKTQSSVWVKSQYNSTEIFLIDLGVRS